MTQYFIESKTKIPQLFYFSQILKEDVDHESLLKKLLGDFENWQQENWINYWADEGEQIILQTWNEKYKDYLKETHIHEELSPDEDGEENSEGVDTKEITPSISDSQISHDEDYQQSWNELWDQHREEIYLEQYLIYTTIFYNYFLDFKNSLEQILPIQEDIYEEDEDTGGRELSEELEQLKLLGLPTSFGGRPQNSSKKSKRQANSPHFSDFFSESEMDASSESEIEETPLTNELPVAGDENPSLHRISKSSQKAKKKNRKLKNVPAFILEEKGLLKYWRKRFSLFSRFDEGIRMDRESFFSVTPEKVAKHLAERLRCGIIIDGFCGSGGNAIQFAMCCDHVIAIDIDPVKLEMAKHNAKIYNVENKIEFILGDFLQLASCGKFQADIVFLSPPWGGPKYKNKKDYDIEKYLLPVKASELVDVARSVSKNIALFLPRNSNVKQVIRLAGVGKSCEIEHSYLDSRLVAITALYGEDILQKKSSNN